MDAPTTMRCRWFGHRWVDIPASSTPLLIWQRCARRACGCAHLIVIDDSPSLPFDEWLARVLGP